MAHQPGCAYGDLDAQDIQAKFDAGQISGMGHAHMLQHIDSCPRGCAPLAEGEPTPMQRFAITPA